MNLELQSMAIEMPAVSRHPNRQPFRGVLTLVDAPSTRPPAGARGHRVLLSRAAAERALASLLGMGLDYTPSLDGHDARRKVGIITSAEIVDGRLEVGGYLFARDFPELVGELAPGGRRLAMSYEIADARVADVRASIWVLTDVTFTGAAILRREKAAYPDTWIELRAGTENTSWRVPHPSRFAKGGDFKKSPHPCVSKSGATRMGHPPKAKS